MKDEEDWFLVLSSNFLLDVLLMLEEELWVKANVSWLIDTVDVAKSGCNREVWTDWLEGLVDVVDSIMISRIQM